MTFEATVANGDTPFVFLRVDFKDCLITSVQTSSAGAEVTEQIEVVFRSVNVQNKELPP
jgi:type VI protein secretion system component Hcp